MNKYYCTFKCYNEFFIGKTTRTETTFVDHYYEGEKFDVEAAKRCIIEYPEYRLYNDAKLFLVHYHLVGEK
jgi:hypothetical protein